MTKLEKGDQARFDDAVDNATHAALAVFGIRVDDMVDTAVVMNDAISRVINNIAFDDGGAFTLEVAVMEITVVDTMPVDRPGFDDALDNATHAVLSAFGLKAENVTDTSDILNSEIEEIMERIVLSDDIVSDDVMPSLYQA